MAMPYPAYNPSNFQPNSYPPNNGPYNPSFQSINKPTDLRQISRTPSPTPSETKALSDGLFSRKQLLDWRFWIRKEWTKYYIIGTVILVITALISIYHHQIIHWLTPVTQWLHSLKYGFLVPIGILFVISFPPLFGHEIVAILCGVVWGLWIGFGIVCAGTFLGEVGNFYAFKYCCRARGEKMERTGIPYACLARCVRTGGFKIALIARFSAIPGHFTTAVFATCGMNIFTFCIAAALSLPKQFITVYVGVILEQSDQGTTSLKSRLISDGVLAATFLVTILAMWYIFHQMALVKPSVIYDRRKARQVKMGNASHVVDLYGNPGLNDSDSSVGAAYNPRESLSDIPLTAKASGSSKHPRYDYEQQQKQRQYEDWLAQREREQQQEQYQHQQWDASGRAIGYTPGPVHQVVYAPQAQRAPGPAVQAPIAPGRSPIQPGAYVVPPAPQMQDPYSRNPMRAETSGEVGWDAQGVQMREREPQAVATPTQAQYASYPHSGAGAGGPTSAPLPTPPFPHEQPRSPFDDPEPAPSHGADPTSYHTAYGGEMSEDGESVLPYRTNSNPPGAR